MDYSQKNKLSKMESLFEDKATELYEKFADLTNQIYTKLWNKIASVFTVHTGGVSVFEFHNQSKKLCFVSSMKGLVLGHWVPGADAKFLFFKVLIETYRLVDHVLTVM